jgi:phage repressor protein C with HTH and peptisase S24 domain
MKPINEIRRLNLANALDRLGLSQTALAAKMKIDNPSIINQHVRGTKNIGDKFARRYEIYLPLPAYDLDSDPDRAREPSEKAQVSMRPVLAWRHEDELNEDYVLVPRLNVKASAGNGKLIWEVDEKGQKQAFRRSWMERLGINPSTAATIVADGSSMATRIEDGDSLVVDYASRDVISGKVYALTFGGELFVKRLFRSPSGGVRIVSDNPDKTRYPDWDVPPEQMDNLTVIAKVVAVSGAL